MQDRQNHERWSFRESNSQESFHFLGENRLCPMVSCWNIRWATMTDYFYDWGSQRYVRRSVSIFKILVRTWGAGLFWRRSEIWARRQKGFRICPVISRKIAGPGELFSSDFQACAQSPRWATRCSLGSVSCSCDAAPRTVVRKRALPVLSAKWAAKKAIYFCQGLKQIEIFQVKAWLATFKTRNANLNLLDDDIEKRK